MQLYGADSNLLVFSSSLTAGGRYITNFLTAGPSWTFTLHGIPTLADIRVEVNNSNYFQIGREGIINPVHYAIRTSNMSSHATSTAIDGSFSANWVILKPQSEFYLNSNSGCVSCDTGVFSIQGQFRYIRLSMSATPLAAGSRAYYFDNSNILRN